MAPRRAGFTLIEVMVSLAVLLVGLLGMMQLQVVGLTWNQSARAHTRATELALELRAGLEQLAFADPRLAVTGGTWTATPPTPFGALLGSDQLADAMVWSDDSPIPGVTLDGQLELDDQDPGRPLYQRRWTVWGYKDPTLTGMDVGALIVAVSVLYHDRGTPAPKEVVVYTQRANPASVFANLAVSE